MQLIALIPPPAPHTHTHTHTHTPLHASPTLLSRLSMLPLLPCIQHGVLNPVKEKNCALCIHCMCWHISSTSHSFLNYYMVILMWTMIYPQTVWKTLLIYKQKKQDESCKLMTKAMFSFILCISAWLRCETILNITCWIIQLTNVN
jgi:hypothetical protein